MGGASVTPEQAGKVAELARLSLSEAETELFAAQLGGILEWVGRLAGVPVEGVPATAHPRDLPCPLRGDVASAGLPPGTVLRAAPQVSDGRIVVPLTVEGG